MSPSFECRGATKGAAPSSVLTSSVTDPRRATATVLRRGMTPRGRGGVSRSVMVHTESAALD